jgi:hypothetical protein
MQSRCRLHDELNAIDGICEKHAALTQMGYPSQMGGVMLYPTSGFYAQNSVKTEGVFEGTDCIGT